MQQQDMEGGSDREKIRPKKRSNSWQMWCPAVEEDPEMIGLWTFWNVLRAQVSRSKRDHYGSKNTFWLWKV